MRRTLLLIALAAAASAFAGDDLTERLKPFSDPDRSTIEAVVYDRYPSGRPRRVVAAIGDSEDGNLMLFRFPDSGHGKPRLLDRQELDSGASSVALMHIIDPKDVIVTLTAGRGGTAIVERVAGNRLIQIADGYTEAIDLDSDGVPEIIATGYLGRNQCGVEIGTWLAHWNGKRFVNDGRRYVTVLSPGGGTEDDEILLSASKRYVVRLFGRGRVTLDGERIQPGKPFKTEEDCHTIALHGDTSKTRAFLEELSH
jgi:hypothetical protein